MEFADHIFKYCQLQLAPYKVPRVIEFVTELPKTISGKIRRIKLRAAEEQPRAMKKREILNTLVRSDIRFAFQQGIKSIALFAQKSPKAYIWFMGKRSCITRQIILLSDHPQL